MGNRKQKVRDLQTEAFTVTQDVVILKRLQSRRALGYKVIRRGMSNTGVKEER